MSKKKRTLHGLGDLQAEVMEIVWDRGESTVSQVHELIGRKRRVTYTTILTAMQKLEKKGWLTHRSEGRAYVYQANRSREDVHAGLLRDFLKQAFQGDPRRMLSHLLDQHPLSDEELADLRKLIDARRKENRHE
jgi:predicted transcriptional regulator